VQNIGKIREVAEKKTHATAERKHGHRAERPTIRRVLHC